MICEDCPFGTLIQIDSLIWMVECALENTLMSRKDECNIPETMMEATKMKLTMDNVKLIKMFNSCYFRAGRHPKKRIRKKNYARALYILRRGNQITRKKWRELRSFK